MPREQVKHHPSTESTSQLSQLSTNLEWTDDDLWQDSGHGDDNPGNKVPLEGTSTSYHSLVSEELEREWRARQQQFKTLGYRDGVTEGQKFSAQQGFNAGFQEASAAGFNWGVTRGLSSAFASLPLHAREIIIKDANSRARLEALHKIISSISTNDALRLFYKEVVASAVTEGKAMSSPSSDELTGGSRLGNAHTISLSDGLSSQSEGFISQSSQESNVDVSARIRSGNSARARDGVVDPGSHTYLDTSLAQMSLSDRCRESPVHSLFDPPNNIADIQKKIKHEFESASM